MHKNFFYIENTTCCKSTSWIVLPGMVGNIAALFCVGTDIDCTFQRSDRFRYQFLPVSVLINKQPAFFILRDSVSNSSIIESDAKHTTDNFFESLYKTSQKTSKFKKYEQILKREVFHKDEILLICQQYLQKCGDEI